MPIKQTPSDSKPLELIYILRLKDQEWSIDYRGSYDRSVMARNSDIIRSMEDRKKNRNVQIPEPLTPGHTLSDKFLIEWHIKKYFDASYDRWLIRQN